MTARDLHQFDLDLCEYITWNVAQHLGSTTQASAHRAKSTLPSIDTRDASMARERQTFAISIAGELSRGLEDYLWQHNADDRTKLLFTDAELDELQEVLSEMPIQHRKAWEKDIRLHERGVYCVAEIKTRLTRRDAEQWSADCARFSHRLNQKGISLQQGIGIVQKWLRRVRRLLRAMNATESLPPPLGSRPTPTNPDPVEVQDIAVTNQEMMSLRRCIALKGKDAKPNVIIKECHIRKARALAGLRVLEKRGQYTGFSRKMHARYVEKRPNER